MLPGCEARTVHVPMAMIVTVFALTRQVAVVREVNVTGRPDEAIADKVSCASTRAPAMAAKEMVWAV